MTSLTHHLLQHKLQSATSGIEFLPAVTSVKSFGEHINKDISKFHSLLIPPDIIYLWKGSSYCGYKLNFTPISLNTSDPKKNWSPRPQLCWSLSVFRRKLKIFILFPHSRISHESFQKKSAENNFGCHTNLSFKKATLINNTWTVQLLNKKGKEMEKRLIGLPPN